MILDSFIKKINSIKRNTWVNVLVIFLVIALCVRYIISLCSDGFKPSELFILLINILLTIWSCYDVKYKCDDALRTGKEQYNKTKSQQVLTAIPGICTAWGIFWTFVSIVVTLGLLSIVGDSDSFTIFNITGSIIPAFATSVIGMTYSIGHSSEITNILADEEKTESANYGNPMMYIMEMAINTKKISDTFVSKNEFENYLKKCFSNNEGKQYLELMSEYMKSQDDKLQRFITEFTTKMENYFSNAHLNFETQMKDYTTTEIEKYAGVLTETGNNLKKVSEDVLKGQKESSDNISKEINESLKAVSTNLKDLVSKIENLNKTLVEKQETKTNEVIDSFEKKISETETQSIGSITTMTDEVNNSLKALSDKIMEKTKDPLENLAITMDRVNESMGKICAAYMSSQEAYVDALQLVHDQNENWNKAAEDTGKTLTSMERTHQGIDYLVKVMQERQDGLGKLKQSIQSVMATIEQLQNLNSILTKISAQS